MVQPVVLDRPWRVTLLLVVVVLQGVPCQQACWQVALTWAVVPRQLAQQRVMYSWMAWPLVLARLWKKTLLGGLVLL